MVGIGLGYKDAKRPEKNSRFLEPAVRSCSFLLGFREARTAVHIWSIEMDLSTPPSLQRLAMQSLLSNQSLAISALEDLPVLLFPPLFLEAYATGLTEGLKAMVQAWPFYCLPLGDLEEPPDLNTFKAVLDGLDLLLAKKERCSGCKLQVLDLRSEHPDIWTLGYPSMDRIFCVNNLADSHSWMMEKHPLTIAFDLIIEENSQDELQTYLLQWARDRKERVQLCPEKLQIESNRSWEVINTLCSVRLDSIQELILSQLLHQGTINEFAPLLSVMKNLHIVHVSVTKATFLISSRRYLQYWHKFGTYLGQVHHLQELHVQEVFFVRGQLPAILRSLKPLKTLSLSSCRLEERDLRFLSRCLCTKQLKHLRLSQIRLRLFSQESLSDLLEHMAGTLQSLVLEGCLITDAQILALLPTLSQCSQLSFFSLYGNPVCMDTLKNLFSHTGRMMHLKRVIYPLPVGIYHNEEWDQENIDPERLAQNWPGLKEVLTDMGIARKVQICTKFCFACQRCLLYSLGPDGCWKATEENLLALSALPM
ncbi:PRAME family member 8-like [Thomomys bottae]